MSSLLEEIKQTKPFASLEEELFLNLQRTAQVLTDKAIEILKQADLTPVQYNVLRILRGSLANGLLCGEISERLVTKDSDITRLLDRLEKNDLVARERSTQDRRAVVVKITKKGLKILAKLDKPVTERIKEQLAHLSANQVNQLNKLLVLARSNEK